MFKRFILAFCLVAVVQTDGFVLRTTGLKRNDISLKQGLKAQKIFIYAQQMEMQPDESGTRLKQLEVDLKIIDDIQGFNVLEIKEYIDGLRLFHNYPDPKIKDTAVNILKNNMELMVRYGVPEQIALEGITALIIKMNRMHSMKNTSETEMAVQEVVNFQNKIIEEQKLIAESDTTGYQLFLIELPDNDENQELVEKIRQQFTSKADEGIKNATELCMQYSTHISRNSPDGLGVYNVSLIKKISEAFLDSLQSKKIPTTFVMRKNGKILLYLVVRKCTIYNRNINVDQNLTNFVGAQLSIMLDSLDNHSFQYIV